MYLWAIYFFYIIVITTLLSLYMSISRKKVFYILFLNKVQNLQKDHEGKGKKIKINKKRRKEKQNCCLSDIYKILKEVNY